MSFSPEAWKRLGLLFQDARYRLGMSRASFSDLAGISEKAVYNAESGDPHKKVPPTYAKYAAALKWTPESVHLVLNGKDPVLAEPAADDGDSTPLPAYGVAEEPNLLELLHGVHEFGRLAVSLGADDALRDELDAAAGRLVRSIPRESPDRSARRLPAEPSRAPGGEADDDAEQVLRAMEQGK